MPNRSRLLLISACLYALSLSGCTGEDSPTLTDRFDPVTQSYAFILPNLKPVAGVGGVRAEDCGRCHQAIYAEWKGSTHASALRDIQFQAEITKTDSPKWLCLNCHIPVQNQRSYLVTHLQDNDVLRPVTKPNPAFDPTMQPEGVTCAACHVRRDEKTGDSYIIGPFETALAPHPVRTDPDFLRTICGRCHNPQGEGLTRNLVCWFETEKELAEAHASDGKLPSSCVDCHMPARQRRLVDDSLQFPHLPIRPTRRHFWAGGGIPKWYHGYEDLLERGYAPALGVKVANPTGVQPGGVAHMTVRLTNRSAGHYLPTADPERFILAVATLRDAAGDTLARQTLRIGQTWEWNPARKVADNRLAQGETREWPVSFSLPASLRGVTLDVTAYHVRLTAGNARYLMQAADSVDEALFPDGRRYVADVLDEYPFATVVYREMLNLQTGARRVSSPLELIELSKAERGKPLSERVY